MKPRDWILAGVSCVGAAVFLLLALKAGKLQPALMLAQVHHAAPTAVIALLVLTGVHIFLSNQKWRCVDAVLRSPGDAVPSQTASFGMTATGVALGQVLPIQLGVVTGRTLGTQFFGRAFTRGTVGSVFEQGFDAVVMVLLAMASGITLSVHGGPFVWAAASAVLVAAALLAARSTTSWVRRFGERAAGSRLLGRMASQRLAELCHAGLLAPALVRKLTALSVARFALQVLMAASVSMAIGAHISTWHLAASIPLVILACVVVLTPGGIGVSELSYAGVLHLFGTPVGVAVEWALAARILISGACFVTAGLAVAAVTIANLSSKRKRSPMAEDDLACSERREVRICIPSSR